MELAAAGGYVVLGPRTGGAIDDRRLFKGVIPYPGNTSRKEDAGQARAAGKGLFSNAHKALRQGHPVEGGAIFKSTVMDIAEPLRKGHGGQGRAVLQGLRLDGGNAVIHPQALNFFLPVLPREGPGKIHLSLAGDAQHPLFQAPALFRRLRRCPCRQQEQNRNAQDGGQYRFQTSHGSPPRSFFTGFPSPVPQGPVPAPGRH